MVGRPRLGDLLDLPPLAQRELRRPPAPVPGVQRGEPISVEVVDHIADPVLTGERHLRDPGHVHALRRQQHHLRAAPGHHRPGAPAHDPHQPPALIIIDLTHPHTLGHRPSLEDHRSPDQCPDRRANVTGYGTSWVRMMRQGAEARQLSQVVTRAIPGEHVLVNVPGPMGVHGRADPG